MTEVSERPAAQAVSELVRVLDLEEIDRDLYRGAPAPNERGRAFGGQVASQSLTAAIRSADEGFHVHSMHGYFLLPGDPSAPIVYDVDRIRDGRSFQTRRVAGRQHGRDIFYLTANFQREEHGFEHQDAMPAALPADQGIDMLELMAKGGSTESESLAREWAAVEVRIVGNSMRGLPPDPRRPARQQVWLRIADRLPDDPNVHIAAFTWASDISLLGASLAAHQLGTAGVQMASLDHTIWFHRPFRADEWWLYDQESPSAENGRGLSLGRVFSSDGRLVATTAQQGIIRPPRS
ncbi:acyl-CoA thioesterase II [Nocardioides sp.]|uniref:acyl-CoA thioesterase n=1 Tax=Nocardioides sp. TaxID=35761 RepID=UPI002CA7330B|nr:acyl-CoA thioesterase II [Nocardioides sp.]HVX54824.1 acyl-CoA thioesterase II [Nocardioides sp.]